MCLLILTAVLATLDPLRVQAQVTFEMSYGVDRNLDSFGAEWMAGGREPVGGCRERLALT